MAVRLVLVLAFVLVFGAWAGIVETEAEKKARRMRDGSRLRVAKFMTAISGLISSLRAWRYGAPYNFLMEIQQDSLLHRQTDASQSCETSADCSVGRRCVAALTGMICHPCNADMPPGGHMVDNGGSNCPHACLSVAALMRSNTTSLIFERHIHEYVLCDAADNCATPGHLVVFRGDPMTMRSYCDRSSATQCVLSVALVNSPRFRWRLRLPSNSPDLQYTAFAATHNTWFEEAALTFLLRLESF